MYFDNKVQRAQWIGQSDENALSFQVEHNPTGVYNWLKKNYANDFTPNWAPGFEKNGTNKEAMYQFLLNKAKRNADPAKYVISVLAAIPGKGANDNTWLK